MTTLAHRRAFNARTQKARISAGWNHDSGHYQFARQHDSKLPFAAEQRRGISTALEAVIGVVALAALLAVLLFAGAGI